MCKPDSGQLLITLQMLQTSACPVSYVRLAPRLLRSPVPPRTSPASERCTATAQQLVRDPVCPAARKTKHSLMLLVPPPPSQTLRHTRSEIELCVLAGPQLRAGGVLRRT